MLKESTSDIRLGALQINELNNVETRFENLKNTLVFDRVTCKRKTASLCEIFLDAKVNNRQLFFGVE